VLPGTPVRRSPGQGSSRPSWRATPTPSSSDEFPNDTAFQQPLHPVRVGSPAYSARVQQFLRGRSLSNPRRYLPACRNGSTRAKYGPNRPTSAPNFCSTRPASTMAAAATSRSLVVHTTPNDHAVAAPYPAATHRVNPLPGWAGRRAVLAPQRGPSRRPVRRAALASMTGRHASCALEV
jgi:hypothetical protein